MTNTKNIYVSARDIAENAKLNHEIAEELRKHAPNHSSSSSGLTRGSRWLRKPCLTWIPVSHPQGGARMTIKKGSTGMTVERKFWMPYRKGFALRGMTVLFLLACFPSVAQAETCTPTPDCKSLGYTQSSCPDGGGVKCPWNTALLYCGENGKKICADMGHPYTCTGANEIPSGKACANKYYTTCTCASGYEWKNGKCEKNPTNGLVGDLYYCNGTVVGIRVPGQNFVIAMKETSDRTFWSSANSYCAGYRFCGTGTEGHLPTKDELLAISNNITYLKDQLQKNGGQQFTSHGYWSSSPYGSDNNGKFWIVYLDDGYTSAFGGSASHYARPVLAF